MSGPRAERTRWVPPVGALLAATTMLASILPGSSAGAPDANSILTTLILFAGTPSGLRRSQDWGATWETRDPAKPDGLERVGAVRAIVPLGPLMYLGGDGGFYFSEDFGRTWEQTIVGPVLCILLSRYFNIEPTVFVGTREGLLKSEDTGRTFRPTALRGTPVTRLDWPGPALIAATGRGVFISIDSGLSFSGPGEGLPAGEVRALAVSSYYPVDPVLFAGVGSAGVFRSGDGARTWKPVGLADHTVTDLAWLGPFLYATTDRGLYRSEDMGRLWTPLRDGLEGAVPYGIFFPAAPDSSAEAFAATDRGIYRTPNGGQNWLPTGLKGEAVLSLGAFPPPPTLGGKAKKQKS
jgi:photosystem II stability/assembly factor-like uncharacterized protein